MSDIIALEKELAENVLSEEAIKSNKHMLLLKLCKGGWMQAKDIFACQQIFTEEKAFFQALIFIKRFTVQAAEQSKDERPSMDNIVIKMNATNETPTLHF